VLFCIKFHQNWMIFFVEICRFNDFQDPSTLNFRNLEFMSRDLYCHALLLSCTKFNSAVEVWPNFFLMVAVRVRHLKFLKITFGRVTVTEFQTCCCVPNLIEIGWSSIHPSLLAQSWRNNNTIKFDDLRYDDLTICKRAKIAILNFRGPVISSLKSPLYDFL